MRVFRSCCAPLLLLLVTATATAEGAAGREVSGIVDFDDGVPLPHATVLLVLPDGTQRQAVTGEDGRFRFTDVPPGPVTVLAIFGNARARASVDGDTPVRLHLDLGAEVVGIRESAPPAEPPALVESSMPRRWPYSDEATVRNAWGVVWLRVAIDRRGVVTGATVLKSPKDLRLDEIAIATAKKLRYAPARDAAGRPVPTTDIVLLQWPPYWNPGAVPVCAGSGPLNLDREHDSAYRDCEPPPGLPHLRLENPRDRSPRNSLTLMRTHTLLRGDTP